MPFLARSTDTGVDGLDRLLTRESGLLGVSGLTSDMQQLLASEKPEAHEAVDLFCYAARKHVAAVVAALNGADTLVFTGGIGEHAGPVRERICAGLQHLGIEIASPANAANAPIISTPASRVTVRVMHTDEDLAIARHVRRLLA
jgi:acetate kinase